MNIQIESAKNPKWANAEGSAIELVVKFAHISSEVPFAASPSDCEAHGRELFDRALASEFGPVEAYAAPVKTPDEIKFDLTLAVQSHLDTTAQARGYDGILSLCTYATSSNSRFAAEGQAGVAWRDAVWTYCHDVLDAVNAGARPAPSVADLVAELPEIGWPV